MTTAHTCTGYPVPVEESLWDFGVQITARSAHDPSDGMVLNLTRDDLVRLLAMYDAKAFPEVAQCRS